MFERLPKPIFYRMMDNFEPRELHKLLSVSTFFNRTINSDEFWEIRIRRASANLMKRYPELNELDAALTAAAWLGLTRYVQKYIDAKANVNVKLYYNKYNDVYVNPIHHAAHSGNLACVKLLVQHNARIHPDKPTEYFNSPIHFAAASGSVDCVNYFLNTGVPVNQASRASPLGWNWTPLQVAASHNRVQCFMLLLQRGANVHYKDPSDFQAIHRASSSGSLECLKLLIAAGADVNAFNEDGVTPLQEAILEGHEACVLELLNHGADARHACSIISINFYLPLHLAFVNDHFNIARVLLEHDPTLVDAIYTFHGPNFPLGDKTALQLGALWGDIKMVQFLLNYNPDPYRVCVKGKTALDYAIENEHDECADLIYEYMIERDFTQSALIL